MGIFEYRVALWPKLFFTRRYYFQMRLFESVFPLITLYFGLRISLSDLSTRTIPNIELLPLFVLQAFQGITHLGSLSLLAYFGLGLIGSSLVSSPIASGDLKLLGILSLRYTSIWQVEFLIFIALCVGLIWSMPILLKNVLLKESARGVPFAPAIFMGYLAVGMV